MTDRMAFDVQMSLAAAFDLPDVARAAAVERWESSSMATMRREHRAAVAAIDAAMDCQADWMASPRAGRDIDDLLACNVD